MTTLYNSPFFGISLTIIAFIVGTLIQKKTKLTICNPLLIAISIIVGVLLLFRIPYESYNKGGSLINLFLAPATACLAVSIYGKMQLLKTYWLPIVIGCTVGSASSMLSIYGLCKLFLLDERVTIALLPKSVTTPIAVSITEAHGGIVPITVAAVVFTGILGSILCPYLIRLFRISNPIASGLAIGASSHAMGTSKALELGETEGAMSSLAIGICGIVTVILSIILM